MSITSITSIVVLGAAAVLCVPSSGFTGTPYQPEAFPIVVEDEFPWTMTPERWGSDFTVPSFEQAGLDLGRGAFTWPANVNGPRVFPLDVDHGLPGSTVPQAQIPEPLSLTLLGSGFIAAAMWMRRRVAVVRP